MDEGVIFRRRLYESLLTVGAIPKADVTAALLCNPRPDSGERTHGQPGARGRHLVHIRSRGPGSTCNGSTTPVAEHAHGGTAIAWNATPKAFHVTPSMRHIQITCWPRRLWQGAVALRHGRSVSIARRQHSILSAWRRPALVSSMYQVKSKRKRAVRGTEPEVRIPQDVSDEASTAPPRALSTVDSLFTVPSLLYRIL